MDAINNRELEIWGPKINYMNDEFKAKYLLKIYIKLNLINMYESRRQRLAGYRDNWLVLLKCIFYNYYTNCGLVETEKILLIRRWFLVLVDRAGVVVRSQPGCHSRAFEPGGSLVRSDCNENKI